MRDPVNSVLALCSGLSPSAPSAMTLNYDAGEWRSRQCGLNVGNKATRTFGFQDRTCSTSVQAVAGARRLVVCPRRTFHGFRPRIHPAAVVG